MSVDVINSPHRIYAKDDALVLEGLERAYQETVTGGEATTIAEPPSPGRRYTCYFDANAFSPGAVEARPFSVGRLYSAPSAFDIVGASDIWSKNAALLATQLPHGLPVSVSSEGENAGAIMISIGSGGLATGSLARSTQIEPLNVEPLSVYRALRGDLARSRDAALAETRQRLDVAKAIYAQMPPRDVVLELNDELGVGQLVIARAAGVTPTAVRKWRRGEPARSEHRDRLAALAALCRGLMEAGVHDPAGWIDIPISSESTLTPLDLFSSRRSDLVMLLGSGLADPQETLDAFSPEWRSAFASDHDYEVVTIADGSRSVVPRREASS